MGLFGAMTASVSGLSAQGEAISVISDNLSNTNTIGYKNSRALFSQLVTTSSTGAGTYNAGGSQSAIQRSQQTQGSIISTTNKTDLAISGNGFFTVTDQNVIGSETQTFYTRAGAFSEDSEGFLTNPQGLYLNGWRTDTSGNVIDLQNPEPIELQSVGVSAQASSTVGVGVNLTASEDINSVWNTGAPLTSATENLGAILNDTTNADYVTDVRLFDAQGGARDISFAFAKRGSNSWSWMAFTDGSNIQGGTPNVNTRIGNGSLEFNQDGTLRNVTGAQMTIPWSGGVATETVTADFGDFTGGAVTDNIDTYFSDGLLAATFEEDTTNVDTTANAGTYTLELTNANEFTLTDPDGQTSVVTVAGAGQQELLFNFPGTGAPKEYDVRMTISASMPVTAAGYPQSALTGNMTVVRQGPQGTGGGTDGALQFAANYNTFFSDQDGFGSGLLADIQIDSEGFISGTFTNGETKKLWKTALAIFQNPSGLETVSGTLLRTTDQSGDALLKEAGVGSTGDIISGSLEGSTTDIANEFSQMIISQRAYQANSTVVSTVDQMLNELLQLR